MTKGVTKNLLGRRFFLLTVLEFKGYEVASGQRLAVWLCRCDCGSERTARASALLRGTCKSCGCLQRSIRSSSHKKHGGSLDREYRIWHTMKQRCLNPKNVGYHRYGGRGITVCDSWAANYSSFIRDMGPAPSEKHSIERIDNNGNYEPGNCRWATAKEQCRNKSDNRYVIIDGNTMTLIRACEIFQINYETARHRLLRGWDIKKTFLTAPRPKRKKNAA